MARFHDLLASLTPEQTTLLPDGLVDSLTEEYTNDIGIREAAIAQRQLDLAARDAIIADKDKEAIALKAANWDMLQATPAKVTEPPADDDDESDEDEIDDDDIFATS